MAKQAETGRITVPDWKDSPVPAVENSLRNIRRKFFPSYPENLDRPLLLLENLGNPHRQLPFTFHVAGTNGKGSTLAFLQAVFEAAGLSVHKYISPHLVRFEERIIVNGKMIEPGLLTGLIDECSFASGDDGISFFEFFTALAFLAYARNPAKALLLETGLGGIYDATNVVEGTRIVSLLTRISHDHTHILGGALPEIARHKAGIIKPACPCIIAPQTSPEVLEVFRNKAEAVAAPVYGCGDGWGINAGENSFEYKSASNKFRLPLPSLPGRHQLYNAGTALAALEKSPYSYLLQQKILEQAMLHVEWPGRLQHVTAGRLAELLPAGWELWLDGAHNDSGAEILAEQAKAWGAALPLHLVTAIKKTKDVSEFYRPLLPYATTIQAVDVSWIGAPMTGAEDLCDNITGFGYKQVKTSPNLESALRSLAFQFNSPQRILVTGSLYLIGHALKY